MLKKPAVKLIFLIVLIVIFKTPNVLAQQGKLDTTFNIQDDGENGDGFDNTVRTLAVQDNGDVIAGGDYLNFNGVSNPYLNRLKPDGTIDPTFVLGEGFNGKVYTTFIQPDGKIIVGGSFTSFAGITANRLVRLQANGTYDASFNTTLETNNIIYDSTQDSSGRTIIVGSFTICNGVSVSRIARILSDGSLDTSFATGSAANSLIEKVIIQADGKIILGGTFTSFNGQPQNHIVRLNPDGSIDNTFNTGSGFDDKVTSMALQSDGKILIVGTFLNYNGISANRIIRLNPDGSKDSEFSSGLGLSNNTVYTVAVDETGNIMIGGSFTGNYNGNPLNRLLFLKPDGTLIPDFDIGDGPASGSVLAIAKGLDGSWFLEGSFTVFDNQNQGRLAKINTDGSLDIGFLSSDVGFNNSVFKVLSLADNGKMVFGSFTKFNGSPVYRIARLTNDGKLDTSYNLNKSGANNFIKTAVQQLDGQLVLGGNFTIYNDVICNRIARIDSNGNPDVSFNVGSGFNNQVYALELQSDQKIIVGGNFTKFNEVNVGRIARLMPDGSMDETFNAGIGADAIVESILVQPDGKILIGGKFETFNGVLSPRLIRLNQDGTIDSSFSVGAGFDKNVYSIALQSDGKIIVGGSFLNYNNIAQKRIVRLLPDGSLDITFNTGTGFSKGDVRTILIQPDDRALLGGTFSGNYNGVPALRMIRLLSSGEKDTTFDAGLNGTLFTMALSSDHRLIIGGNFNSVSGIAKHRIARLSLCTNSSVWDGVSWSNGSPSAGKELIFNADYLRLETAFACNCFIASDKIVTLASNHSLSLTFDYSGLGTLVLEDSASLYQFDDEITNTGIIHLKRNTTIRKFDFTFWSSPVDNQKLIEFSPLTLSDKYQSYNGVKWVTEDPAGAMKKGKGYNIRGPQTFSKDVPALYEATFKGVPNNGKITGETVESGKYYLVGNPYPTALDAVAFLSKNKFLDGTIYFWTHQTPLKPNGTKYSYSTNDYASYNAVGGIKTQRSGKIPTGFVASGQSFFARAVGNGEIHFSNQMRSRGEDNKNTQFFKPSGIKNKEAEEARIWINLSNENGIFKQLLIGYVTEATNDFESKYDGVSLSANSYVNFYSICDTKNLAIQGRRFPFDSNDTVTLGYSAKIEEKVAIEIDSVDGVLKNKDVFLEDKITHLIHNLKDKPYWFTTNTGTFNDRFVLRFTNSTLQTNEPEKIQNNLIIYQNQNQLVLDSPKEKILKIQVFDVAGQLILEQDANQKKITVLDLKPKNRVLIVKVETDSNTVLTQKVLF
ncbi:calcium-binding protein [Flavobacterium sp. GA093]|uniref:Calcium-binding protein n=1 Tax=Flavobacterium hydrocarbonoxydans TaxID=2683249 RepID=A0A6I4NGC3_9FLAO|nr:delta-60 repeat domain-containing protein [Flavobacterium hydrocarbonoxydans]MWB93616.1 calcium-binding protein [Flavobacterium hydrocarbonoxydans]